MRIALVSCAVVGCAYRPGSFSFPPQPGPDTGTSQRVTVGCLDVAIHRRADGALGPVLGFQFANRCDRPMLVDFAAMTVIGRDAQGDEVSLPPYDPHREVRPMVLDGRNVGAEALLYVADRAVPEVCADAATLVHQAPPSWQCFAAPAPQVGRQP